VRCTVVRTCNRQCGQFRPDNDLLLVLNYSKKNNPKQYPIASKTQPCTSIYFEVILYSASIKRAIFSDGMWRWDEYFFTANSAK